MAAPVWLSRQPSPSVSYPSMGPRNVRAARSPVGQSQARSRMPTRSLDAWVTGPGEAAGEVRDSSVLVVCFADGCLQGGDIHHFALVHGHETLPRDGMLDPLNKDLMKDPDRIRGVGFSARRAPSAPGTVPPERTDPATDWRPAATRARPSPGPIPQPERFASSRGLDRGRPRPLWHPRSLELMTTFMQPLGSSEIEPVHHR